MNEERELLDELRLARRQLLERGKGPNSSEVKRLDKMIARLAGHNQPRPAARGRGRVPSTGQLDEETARLRKLVKGRTALRNAEQTLRTMETVSRNGQLTEKAAILMKRSIARDKAAAQGRRYFGTMETSSSAGYVKVKQR